MPFARRIFFVTFVAFALLVWWDPTGLSWRRQHRGLRHHADESWRGGAAVRSASRRGAAGVVNETQAAIRRAAVIEAFQHSWRGYRSYAWGKDELKPLTDSSNDAWGGFGVTMVDGLDTAYLLGLQDEFDEAVSEPTPSCLRRSCRS